MRQPPPRIDTVELKSRIIRKLGHQRSERYFSNLNRLLGLKMRKSEFNRVLVSTIGKENVGLHNKFITAIIKNACNSKTPPPKGSREEDTKVVPSLSGEVINPSPRKSRSSFVRGPRCGDRPSPLGPHGKGQSIVCGDSAPRTNEHQSGADLVSPGSRPPVEVFSVEEGEEVDQMMGSPPSIQSRSPVRAPLGIPMNAGMARKALRNSCLTSFQLESCCNSYGLPDTLSLRKRLEQKLEKEGLAITRECVDLLNSGLDVFLKRLIKPCMELAGSRFGAERCKQVGGQIHSGLNGTRQERYAPRSSQNIYASLLDFRTAMELNPKLLGEDWPVQLERICLRTVEE